MPWPKRQGIDDPRFSIRHQGFSHLGELPEASVAGFCWTWASARRRWTTRRVASVSDLKVHWTCVWTPPGATVWRSGWHMQGSNEITEVIREYGEERFAGPIAKAIVARRQARGDLVTTTELAQLVADTVKTREPGQNPATRTFQAFRIFINAELEELQQALAARSVLAARWTAGGDQLSLAGRPHRQTVHASHSREVFDRRAPFAAPQVMHLKALGRSRPGAAEVAANPRARSAIMRVAQRTGDARGGAVMRLNLVLLLGVVLSACTW
jgi:16S rRNA (cytosine1402-N4)-methyltransferase